MPIVCGIQFRGAGKIYFFDPASVQDLAEGDRVVVETARGRELGSVAQAPHQVDESKIVGELKPVCSGPPRWICWRRSAFSSRKARPWRPAASKWSAMACR